MSLVFPKMSIALAVYFAMVSTGSPLGAQTVSVQPPSGVFANTTVGLSSGIIDFVITNTGSTTLTIDSISLSPSQFVFGSGWTPYVMTPGFQSHYAVKFSPDSAQTFDGSLTINISGLNPIVVHLSGTGLSTGAAYTLSDSVLAFPSQPVGNTSSHTVVVTNTGTTNMTVTGVQVDPPFAVSGFKSTLLIPGGSANIPVIFTGTVPGSFKSLLLISYDVLQPNGVSLSGVVSPPTSLAVSTFYTLPAGTTYTELHDALKAEGFVIYAGQGDLSKTLFRISTMGAVTGADISRLLKCFAQRV